MTKIYLDKINENREIKNEFIDKLEDTNFYDKEIIDEEKIDKEVTKLLKELKKKI